MQMHLAPICHAAKHPTKWGRLEWDKTTFSFRQRNHLFRVNVAGFEITMAGFHVTIEGLAATV
jgi:hypothetical protein